MDGLLTILIIMIKKTLISFFLLFILLPIVLEAQEKTREFTIAVDPNYLPYSQRNIDGKPVGYLVQFWQLWAQKNHYKVHFKFYDWSNTLRATELGLVDFHSGTDASQKWMHASKKIYEIESTFFVPRQAPIFSAKDLEGKRIGVIDSYYGERVQAMIPHAEIVRYSDYDPLIKSLESGEIDAFYEDKESVLYYLVKLGKLDLIRPMIGKGLTHKNSIYAITNAEHASIIPVINAGIRKIRPEELARIESIWFLSLSEPYYTHQIAMRTMRHDLEYRWIRWGVTAVLGLLALLGLGVLLRRRYESLMHEHREVMTLSRTDALTGLLNRRAFDHDFYHQKKLPKDLSAVMTIDLDFFKEYNDHYGHISGDEALQKIGYYFRSLTDDSLMLYRIGGDEFVLLLYGKSREAVEALAESIIAGIGAQKITHEHSPAGILTCTIGIALLEKEGPYNPVMLYKTSDQALYQAKHDGRQRYSVMTV